MVVRNKGWLRLVAFQEGLDLFPCDNLHQEMCLCMIVEVVSVEGSSMMFTKQSVGVPKECPSCVGHVVTCSCYQFQLEIMVATGLLFSHIRA